MKLKVAVEQNNLLVPRQVVRVYRVAPFGIPAGIPISTLTAEGQLIVALAADTPTTLSVPASGSGQVLTYDPGVSGKVKWAAGSGIENLSLVNGSGGDLTQGAVVVQDKTTADQFTTTTLEEVQALGVLAAGVLNGAEGAVIQVGPATVLVQGNVSIGDYLVTSSTAGRAKSNGSKSSGAFAIALTAYSGGGAGTVDAAMIPVIKNVLTANRNLLINGEMKISQRGTTGETGVTTSGYKAAPDRWVLVLNAAGAYTVSRDTDVPAGQGRPFSYKIECTTADASPAAGDYFVFTQKIEGLNLQQVKKGTSYAEKLTLQFWVRSSVTGTYIAELEDQANVRAISQAYTINAADTWEFKTLTFDADATGTIVNDSLEGLAVNLWLVAGSDFSSGTLATAWAATTSANRAVGQSNFAGTIGNIVQFTGLQLEIGEIATEFERIPFDEELRKCFRYYYHTWEGFSAYGVNQLRNLVYGIAVSSNQIRPLARFPVPFRGTPSSLKVYSYAGNVNKISSSATFSTDVGNTVTCDYIGTKSWQRVLDSGTAFSSGTLYAFHYEASAEL